jgi:hypothetical protein
MTWGIRGNGRILALLGESYSINGRSANITSQRQTIRRFRRCKTANVFCYMLKKVMFMLYWVSMLLYIS